MDLTHLPAQPVPAGVATALGAARADAILAGEEEPREWRAIRNRDSVYNLSKAGRPVASIAAELGLSYRHVVALRAQLGVGRRR